MSTYFTDRDGFDEPTIWEQVGNKDPQPVVRRAELPAPHTELLWSVLVGALCADDETVDALAMSLQANPARHLQSCPVWTQRQRETRRDPCNCHWSSRVRRCLAALREVQ